VSIISPRAVNELALQKVLNPAIDGLIDPELVQLAPRSHSKSPTALSVDDLDEEVIDPFAHRENQGLVIEIHTSPAGSLKDESAVKPHHHGVIAAHVNTNISCGTELCLSVEIGRRVIGPIGNIRNRR
jgi:hypothetical protein